MQSLVLIFKNIKNLLPYLLLISLYFLFINLETIKESKTNKILKEEHKLSDSESNIQDKQFKIPVIPYTQ